MDALSTGTEVKHACDGSYPEFVHVALTPLNVLALQMAAKADRWNEGLTELWHRVEDALWDWRAKQLDEMLKGKCMSTHCPNKVYCCGCCKQCYRFYANLVHNGKTSWERLEAEGKIRSKKVRRKRYIDHGRLS